MKEFFDQMSSLEQTYWIIAIIGSVIFIVIMIMTLFGGDMDSDMELDEGDFQADDGGVGFQFFTFKNLVAFFTIFGWTGVVCIDNGFSTGLTLFIAAIAGLAMMVATSSLFYFMYRLSESGTLQIKNAVGTIGEVYLPIGANRSKTGKIQIKVQGALRELEALTDEDEDLKTGTVVKVTEVVSAELLLVQTLSKTK
jgi:membrane protein implicated in regulation of membrane protease activity